MKKRLLLQLLAVVCVIGAHAATKVGDAIYSPTAKYLVTGPNLFANGCFDVGDGFDGWTNENGESVNGEVWKVFGGLGPNGENVVQSLKADTTFLSHVMPLSAGFYAISYWVKSPSVTSSSITTGGANYVNFFTNETGDNTITTQIASTAPLTTEWSQVVTTFTAASDCYLVFNANNVATDIQFTNFEVFTVDEVYDTRIADRKIAFMEKLLNEPEFVDGAGDVLGMLGVLKDILAQTSPQDYEGAFTGMMSEIEPLFNEYISSMAGNVISTTTDGIATTRYLTDWSTWGYMNWNNMVNRGTWSFEGARWGFSPNNGDLERPAEDGYVASAGIQTSYDMTDKGVRIAAGALNNTSLKAGKYMFSIEAQAVASSNKSAPYGADHSVIIAEPSIWVGKDTITFENDTLNGYYWKRYYAIREITDDDIANGVEVSAGFRFPEPVVSGKGGRYSLRNPEFRVIGKSQEEIDHMYSYDQLAVQQSALKQRLELAAEDLLKTKADGYPWGHKVLQDSIDKYTAVYSELLTVVDAEGNELQPEKVTLAYKDEILAAVQNMNRARNNYANSNKVYQMLISDVALCNTSLNAEENAAGDKATFKTVIDASQAMIDATTLDADEMDAFNKQDTLLLQAKEAFEFGTASRANPANLYVANKNLNFESWSSKSTYSSDQVVNGWSIFIGADGKQWDISPNDAYEFGHFASIWRGTSVGPNGKMKQNITLTTPGVYEFRSRAFSAEYGDQAKWAEYMNVANICGSDFDPIEFIDTPVDTVYHPNIRLFFGPDGATNDSITLTKCAPADYLTNPNTGALIYTRATPMGYSIIYIKKDNKEEVCEFGFEAFENGATSGANTFGFGDNRLYYLGSEDAYTTATEADYNAEVANAKALIKQYGAEDEQVGWIIYKLMRLVGDSNYPWAEGLGYVAPTTLQEKQNIYLTLIEYEDMIKFTKDPATLGINEVTSDAQQTAVSRKGIYSINGVRMQGELKSLPRGLYIVNGKKVIIK